MAGYEHKVLELSHGSSMAVEFTIEVDFLGTDQWSVYDTIAVNPGETVTHVFEDGYSAHWVRLVSDTATQATAWFTYSATSSLPGDYDNDGDVDLSDYDVWKNSYGSSSSLAADGNNDGVVNAADYSVWRDNLGFPTTAEPSPQSAPEPSAIGVLGMAPLLLTATRPQKTVSANLGTCDSHPTSHR